MVAGPTPAGIALFLASCWLSVTLCAQPLWALLGPEIEILERVNEVRAERHLGGLQNDPDLARVAQAHADDMAKQGYLDHIDKSGRNPLERVQAAGISGFRLLAENIGSTNENPRVAVLIKSWLASPIHRENVLNPAFNSSGIGVATRPDGTTIAVQLFATF
jgi:uncharacterized protein YkwD